MCTKGETPGLLGGDSAVTEQKWNHLGSPPGSPPNTYFIQIPFFPPHRSYMMPLLSFHTKSGSDIQNHLNGSGFDESQTHTICCCGQDFQYLSMPLPFNTSLETLLKCTFIQM